MEKEFKPQVEPVKVDPAKIKAQYSQMNQLAEQQMQQPQISKEEMERKVKEEEERLDLMLPYYRKQKEALELEIAITTLEVQMGKIAPHTIPGIIGKNLEIQDMEAKQQWAYLKMQQQNMLNDLNKKKEELGKEENTKEEKFETKEFHVSEGVDKIQMKVPVTDNKTTE